MNAPNNQPAKGCVFNIQHYSVHDGPGIRTIVFLKGCPLSCRWCSNPESQKMTPEVAFNPNKCIGWADCFRCGAVCPSQAVRQEASGKISLDRQACTECFACVDACPPKALHLFGAMMSVDEVMKAVERDSAFYSRSEGGLTISGGEPLVQTEFTVALLKEAKRRRINTAMETCGAVEWERLQEACQHLNFLLYDIKSVDSQKHKEFTGADNALIMENLRKIRQTFPQLDVLVRTPLIPGFNDTEAEIAAIVGFVNELHVGYELLPYHRMGQSKYQFLDREYPMGEVKLEEERARKLTEYAKQRRNVHADH